MGALKKSLAILVGILAVFLFFKNSFFDFVALSDKQFLQYYGSSFVEALKQDRSSIFSEDTLRTLFFVLATGAVLFAYLKQKISQNTTITLIVLALLLDLVGVDRRYVNSDNFVSAVKVDKPF